MQRNIFLRAANFAELQHSGQQRKYTGEPYFVHCIEVASHVISYTGDVFLGAAAVLHDIVEDTSCTLEDIENFFGHHIAIWVDQMTDKLTPADGNRAFRKDAYANQLYEACHGTQIIKCADIISNTGSIVDHDLKFAAVYLPEVKDILWSLTKVHHTDIHNRALACVKNALLKLANEART